MGFMSDANDPLTLAMAPPLGETAEERTQRLKCEQEAKLVSDNIDEGIKKDRLALKKQKDIVRVLLLGQSESGKSTTLKNFRMKHARSAWKKERASWRAVIQLNVLRSIIRILDSLQAEMDGDSPDADDDVEVHNEASDKSPLVFSEKHQILKLRLAPLRKVESDLKRLLGAGSEEVQPSNGPVHAAPFDPEPATLRTSQDVRPRGTLRHTDEFHVRVLTDVFARTSKNSSHVPHSGQENSVPDETTEIISRCKDDMKALWEDSVVRDMLRRRRIRLEDSAGFFLHDLDRIATSFYEPSDDDIVRARLRTLGVQEFKLHFDESMVTGSDYGREWIMYDVGGARTCRSAWLPYFENIDAIIFLAPISCFNERLAEDPSINRLEDSFMIWRGICSSKLLTKTIMIVFLNKCDLLKRKLKNGVMVNRYLPSYGDRSNDVQTVVKYLRDKFKDTLKQNSPEPRVCYLFATSVTDTKATASTLRSVRDGILREHLKNAEFV